MRIQGYSILRFWSHDILKYRSAVCETVLAALDGRLIADVVATDLRFVFSRSRNPFPSLTDPSS
jgi:very-short-patch-repair endonuclease